MKKIQWRCLILSILATLTMVGVCFAGIPIHAYYASGNSVDGSLIASATATTTLESNDISFDHMEWRQSRVIDVWSVPGDIAIEDLFVQDCVKIGWNRKTGKFVCHEYHKQISSKGEGKMFSFLFGWIGSLAFWAMFVFLSLFIGTMLLKRFAPRTFEFVTTGKMHIGLIWIEVVVILAGLYLFWPLVIVVVVLCYIIKYIAEYTWGRFCYGIKSISENLPTISFEKKPSVESEVDK